MTTSAPSLLCTALFLVACSASTDPSAEGSGDNSGGLAPGDNAGDGGSSNGDASGSGASPGDGATAGGPDDFEECAKDKFEGEVGSRAGNIVWVIDTSGSMNEEAELVQQNQNAFVKQLAAAGLSDYRVVMISEPEFVSVPDPLGSDPQHFLYVDESVGSHEALEVLIDRFDDYASFLIRDVMTHFVVVTDDESSIRGDAFVRDMTARLPFGFRVHAVASPPGAMPAPPGKDEDGCSGVHGDAAAPGVEHYVAAKLTQGLTFSICADDWSPLFTELAEEVVTSAPLPCDLSLPEPSGGGSLDPNLVNVVLTAPGATLGNALPRVDAASDCAASGWYYDDPSKPSRIMLCPASCAAAAAGGTLEVALGCQTVVE